ncbi:MAG: rane-flanked domain protein [Thermoleophilia bacterium]|nr:rane-flanked domain protein [Thermoleophilia bacterium]
MRQRRSSLHRYLGAGEEPVLITRQHPFALVGAALHVLGLLVPLAIATWGISGIELLEGPVADWLVRVAFLAMFALLGRLAWDVLGWEFERVVVTGEKVIHLEGVLHRRIASTPLAKVSEFTVRQPLLGRVLDYGSLVVDVPGGRDQALHGLAYLPDPAGLYRMVSDLARRGRMQEGGSRVPVPSAEDVAGADATRIGDTQAFPAVVKLVVGDTSSTEFVARPDPWAPSLEGNDADHTITIPRIPPPD